MCLAPNGSKRGHDGRGLQCLGILATRFRIEMVVDVPIARLSLKDLVVSGAFILVISDVDDMFVVAFRCNVICLHCLCKHTKSPPGRVRQHRWRGKQVYRKRSSGILTTSRMQQASALDRLCFEPNHDDAVLNVDCSRDGVKLEND